MRIDLKNSIQGLTIGECDRMKVLLWHVVNAIEVGMTCKIEPKTTLECVTHLLNASLLSTINEGPILKDE